MSAVFGPGMIFVPTDTPDSPNALIDAATGAVLANPSLPITQELGAQWLDGTFALTLASNAHLVIYSAAFALLSETTLSQPFVIGSDLQSRFYAQENVPNVLTAYAADGTVIDTWTATPDMSLLAVNPSNTLLFYVALDGHSLHVYDLIARADGGQIASFPSPAFAGDDLLYIPSTPPSLLLILTPDDLATPKKFFVNRYGLDGTLIQQYPLPDDSDWNDDPRLSINAGAPADSFLVRAFPKASPDVPHSIIRVISISGGGTIDIEYPLDDPSVIPFSCPNFFFGLPSQVPVFIGTRQTMPIRRERTFALPIAPGNARTTLSRLELQFQPGTGTPTDPLAVPEFFCDVSWDNGKTFSNERLMSAGREGAYLTRAFLNILGNGRFGVVRIVTTDTFVPVLTDCFVWTSEGAH